MSLILNSVKEDENVILDTETKVKLDKSDGEDATLVSGTNVLVLCKNKHGVIVSVWSGEFLGRVAYIS